MDFGAVEEQAFARRLEKLAALGVLIQQQRAQVGHAMSPRMDDGGFAVDCLYVKRAA